MTVGEYFLPNSLEDALELIDRHGSEILVMGGGTVVMPLINGGISMPKYVLGLKNAGLDGVAFGEGQVTIGAATPLSKILELETIPMLQQAAKNTAAWSIRNLGTIGGNLFVPPPAGDMAVALLALESKVKLVSSSGGRIIPLAEFYTGFLSNVMKEDELLIEIVVPIPTGRTVYIKYGRRDANTPSIVTVAAQIVLGGTRVEKAVIALNGVGPHPIRAHKAEAALTGQTLEAGVIVTAAKAAEEECQPFTDAIATEWYRRKMTGVYVKRALHQLMEEA